MHWYKPSDGTGYNCTNGANQKASLTLGETGYNLDVGLMKESTSVKYAVFLKVAGYKSTVVNRTYNMKHSTALYKPYVFNKSDVSMTVKAGGIFELR